MAERYRLPFDPTKHEVKIFQGRNGPYDHSVHQKVLPENVVTVDLAAAVDFALDLGTEVLASRSGRVLMGVGRSETVYGDSDPNIGRNMLFGTTNFLIIGHEDGAQAWYSHLANGSLKVDTGEWVYQGQHIADTGLSGWVGSTPHLHFMVSDASSRRSIPVVFDDYDGPLEHKDL